MRTSLLSNASRHSHLRLRTRQQLGLAIMPTVVVLLMVAGVEAFSDQLLIFASLASSAFLVYLDPERLRNRARTFFVAQGSAALLGFGFVSMFGTGFLAAAVTIVLTVVLIISWDAMHPPAMSTALSFALHTASLKTLLIFGLAMLVVGSFAGLQKAVFGWYKKQV